MPAGAQVVPKNAAGDREVVGWKFYYKGWHHHLDNGDFGRQMQAGRTYSHQASSRSLITSYSKIWGLPTSG